MRYPLLYVTVAFGAVLHQHHNSCMYQQSATIYSSMYQQHKQLYCISAVLYTYCRQVQRLRSEEHPLRVGAGRAGQGPTRSRSSHQVSGRTTVRRERGVVTNAGPMSVFRRRHVSAYSFPVFSRCLQHGWEYRVTDISMTNSYLIITFLSFFQNAFG